MKVISKENGNFVIREQQEESSLVTLVKGIIMLGALAYTFITLGGIWEWKKKIHQKFSYRGILM